MIFFGIAYLGLLLGVGPSEVRCCSDVGYFGIGRLGESAHISVLMFERS
jgi:hypothetical protein